ncbi:MAG: ATP synthase F1 subunit delta [Acidobacteria bacterium]|nr:ATP synthase F1 subunit delta [Acidobacteriota bacterium]
MALAIANRYAAALDDVLVRTGQQASSDAILSQLRAFARLLQESGELRNVLASPAVSAADKRGVIDALCARLGAAKPARNLLLLLSDRRRAELAGEVAEAFSARLDGRRGVARVRVTSAAPLTEQERSRLLETFAGITGKQTEAEYTVDESLLGGAVVRVGGQVFDGSIAAQLRALSSSMAGTA